MLRNVVVKGCLRCAFVERITDQKIGRVRRKLGRIRYDKSCSFGLAKFFVKRGHLLGAEELRLRVAK